MSISASTKQDQTGHFVLLHPQDNVLVCAASAPAGTPITIDERECTLSADIALGHKIARHPLAIGDQVLRYGVPIGSITKSVEAGDHVHNHNLSSDYIPAHGRDAIKVLEPGS